LRRSVHRASPVRIVARSFLITILTGAVLLVLPISSAAGRTTNFVDSLFTATSATCVTGLVVTDTAAHWSVFGKIVIMLLIQIGGLGTMTIVTTVMVLLKRKLSLYDSQLIMQSAGATSRGGILGLLRNIFTGTILFELLGAGALATQFVPLFGWRRGIFYSIFHSVSAFCNAGFDILGDFRGGSSLSAFAMNPVVNLTICALIVIGGLGFVVWNDILGSGFRIRKLQVHSKLVLTATGVLIAGGWALFLLFEHDHAFAQFSPWGKALAALFQSVTPRTAGFASVDQATLSESGSFLTIFLMFVGGSPGSTAGGIKTTTMAVVLIGLAASASGSQPTVFRRRIDDETIRTASAVSTIYFFLVLFSTMVICRLEPFPLKDVAFEVVSAVGTVGLSMGITSHLHAAAKLILTFLMYSGRIGGLTAVIILSQGRKTPAVSHPAAKLLIG